MTPKQINAFLKTKDGLKYLQSIANGYGKYCNMSFIDACNIAFSDLSYPL